jgi:phospholipase/carboxylesterase
MSGPHAGGPVATAGVDASEARAGVVLVHGRGATAEGFVPVADELGVEGVAYRAPQAARGTWYPNSFLAPVESNEPGLSSGLSVLGEQVAAFEAAGVPTERVVVVGFSQGACLGSEFVARNPRRYGGLVAFSGGLIGEPGTVFEHEGDLAGAPAFFGCSDRDPHIPEERVHESTAVFERLGADVTERIYEGMGHTINDDELDHLRDHLDRLVRE